MADKPDQIDIDLPIQFTETQLLMQAQIAHLTNRNLVLAQILADEKSRNADLTAQLEKSAELIERLNAEKAS